MIRLGGDRILSRVWVTCYADASLSGRDAAWAVWLRCDEGRLVRSGPCPRYVRDSNAAELAAIFAGVHLTMARWGERVRGISVRSDSRVAIELAASGAPPSRDRGCRRLQTKLRELVEQRGIDLDARWVRGHQPLANGTVAFLNGRCDALAKQARRAFTHRR